jgi:3',5'-cyclic AMP phosphodiesterase CpdA
MTVLASCMRQSIFAVALALGLAACSSSAAGNGDYMPATPAQLGLLRNTANIAAVQDSRSGDAKFQEVIAAINAYTMARSGQEKPLFVVHTGDIVPTGMLMEWHRYARLREKLLLPLVHVRGNHEVIFGTGPQNFVDLVGSPNWTFDFAGCRFIGLDDSLDHFTPEAIALLRDSLALRPAQHTFLFYHEPPAVGRWTVHSVKPDDQGGRGDEVIAAATAAGVDAVFLGHIHLYDEMEIGGVSYIISGGAGSPLHEQYGFGRVEHGFVVVTVQRDGVAWTWVPLTS